MKKSIFIETKTKSQNVFTTIIEEVLDIFSIITGTKVTRYQLTAIASICFAIILCAWDNFVCGIFAVLFLLLGAVTLITDEEN